MTVIEKLDVEDMRCRFRDDLEETARWRMEKAAEYPHDAARNIEAAGICRRLAGTCDAIETNVLQVHCDAVMKISGDESKMGDFTESRNELLRGIGFDTAWPTAADYVEHLASSIR